MKPKVPEAKAVRAEFKAGAAPGEFTAEWSVFENIDRVKDVVVPGAFKAYEGKASEELPPVVWSHLWDVPPIGLTLDVTETATGAKSTGRLFVSGSDDHKTAREVYTAMKGGALKQFSFSYFVPEGGSEMGQKDGVNVRYLKSLDVIEWGPCLIGVNPATQLLDAPKHLAAALASGDVTRPLLQAIAEGKACGDIESYAVYLLLEMLQDASSYIANADEPEDVSRMRDVANALLALLTAELQENEADEGTAKALKLVELIAPAFAKKLDAAPEPVAPPSPKLSAKALELLSARPL
jgi:HK97 family phage prohead protease